MIAGSQISITLGLVACLFSAYKIARLRGTTLLAPGIWVLVALLLLLLQEIVKLSLEAGTSGNLFAIFELSAGVATLCPMMAVMGAKRPQDIGWQWVVLTLWLILLWPAIQTLVLPAGPEVELFIAWKLFLLGLIGLGLLNYLPTRNWLPAVLVACGQFVLLEKFLWNLQAVEPAWKMPIVWSCFLVAPLVADWPTKQADFASSLTSPAAIALNRRWRMFRNSFGAFWALRILQRVNQTAELKNWPIRLGWSGITHSSGQLAEELPGDLAAEIDQAMSDLLRRFV